MHIFKKDVNLKKKPFYFDIFVDSHAVVRNNTEKYYTFTQIFSVVTSFSYSTRIHNQEADPEFTDFRSHHAHSFVLVYVNAYV